MLDEWGFDNEDNLMDHLVKGELCGYVVHAIYPGGAHRYRCGVCELKVPKVMIDVAMLGGYFIPRMHIHPPRVPAS